MGLNLGNTDSKPVRNRADAANPPCPDAMLNVESARVNREPEQPVRVAVHRLLAGSHSGYGHFGEPTGAPIHAMAMSHINLTRNHVTAEYLVAGDASIWKQIRAHVASRNSA